MLFNKTNLPRYELIDKNIQEATSGRVLAEFYIKRIQEFSLDNHLHAMKRMVETGAFIYEKERTIFSNSLYNSLNDNKLDLTPRQTAEFYYYFNQNHKCFDFKDPIYIKISELLDELIAEKLNEFSDKELCLVFYFAARTKRNKHLSALLSNCIESKLYTMDYNTVCELLSSMRVQKDFYKNLIDQILLIGVNNPQKVQNLTPESLTNVLFCLGKEIGDPTLVKEMLLRCSDSLEKSMDYLEELSLEFFCKLLHALGNPSILKMIEQSYLNNVRQETIKRLPKREENLWTAASALYGEQGLNDKEVCQLIVKKSLENSQSIEFTKLIFILNAMPFAESGPTHELFLFIMSRIKESYDKAVHFKGKSKTSTICKNLKALSTIIQKGFEVPNNIIFLALNSLKPEYLGEQVSTAEEYITLAVSYLQFSQSVGMYKENFETFCMNFAKRYIEGFFLQDKTFSSLSRQCSILEVFMKSSQVMQDQKLLKRVMNMAVIYFPIYLQQLIEMNNIELDESGITFLQLMERNKEHLALSSKPFKDIKKYFKQYPSFIDCIEDPVLKEFVVHFK